MVQDKERLIAYAGHLDSHIFAYYSTQLSSLYESQLLKSGLDRCVLAYRRFPDKQCNIHFARQAFAAIRQAGECDVIAMDVEGFFDNLDHALLKDQWMRILGGGRLPDDHWAVYKAITHYSTVDRDALVHEFGASAFRFHRHKARICEPAAFRERVRGKGLIIAHQSTRGIPQGSPISAVLSNLYMLGFDSCLQEAVTAMGGTYYRYSDDMLIVCPVGKDKLFLDKVREELAQVYLAMSEEKTKLRRFRLDRSGRIMADKPIQYLGFEFDGQAIAIRSSTVARFRRMMKQGIRAAIRRSDAKGTRFPYRMIYGRYSHLGRRNYPDYARRAGAVLGNRTLRQQRKRDWAHLRETLDLLWTPESSDRE